MRKHDRAEATSSAPGTKSWIARDAVSGRFVEVRSTPSQGVEDTPRERLPRRPGRFKGILKVGPEFFEPLTEQELSELNGA